MALVRRTADGQTGDVLPAPWNIRTRVHEYGGMCYTVQDGVIHFSNFSDQRVYRFEPGKGEPTPITPSLDFRYADGAIDRKRLRMICVREDHTGPRLEAANTLVALGMAVENSGQILVSGNDFYASPELNSDGTRLAWLAWNHPNMPWDRTGLWVAQVTPDGFLIHPQFVAGGPNESICQPLWSPDGKLYFISDRSGWWNLYCWNEPHDPSGAGPAQREQAGEIEPLAPMEAEFGEPLWNLGRNRFGFISPSQIVCIYDKEGCSHLAVLEVETRTLKNIPSKYSIFSDLHARNGQAVMVAGSADQPGAVVRFELSSGEFQTISSPAGDLPDPAMVSIPEDISFPTENGLEAHALYYAPKNPDFTGPEGEKPPLIVMSHGGPTGFASASYRPRVQFWTSRGFAVVDVNYGGSSGYGRAYRQRLQGQWGIVDVDDCANAARYLAQQGLVDAKRMAITGGSAGGYTTLCALTFRDVFRAGASHYGVADLEELAKDTHKFEARYLDGLVGSHPEKIDLYRQRSPIHATAQLSCPVIFFQGLEDKVVPPAQSESMYESVRARGIPTAYITFPGEQHGFRRAENIQRALEAELYFYSRIFGFELAEPVEPIHIENLD